MPAAAHPYFMSISHRIQWMLKYDCQPLKPFSQRNKKNIYKISCDLSFWLSSKALASGPMSQPSHILPLRVSETVLILHCVTQNQRFLQVPSWLYEHSHTAIIPWSKTFYCEDNTSRINPLCRSSLFYIAKGNNSGRGAFSYLPVHSMLSWLRAQRWEPVKDPKYWLKRAPLPCVKYLNQSFLSYLGYF